MKEKRKYVKRAKVEAPEISMLPVGSQPKTVPTCETLPAVIDNAPQEIIKRENIITYLNAFGLTSQLSEPEAEQFIQIATAFQLNPFKREIYCVPYNSNVQDADGTWKKERKLSIITGYEVYTKRAERSGKLSGWKVTIEGKGADMKAVITIHRRDWKEPLVHEVLMSEYNTDKSLWKKKPVTMLKKVAIAQGFRFAFPEETGGMPCTSDELPENMTQIEYQKQSKIGEYTGEPIAGSQNGSPESPSPEDEKKNAEKEAAKIAATEKVAGLPDDVKAGFKNIDYTGAMVFMMCENLKWDVGAIKREVNRIADMKAASK